MGGYPIPDRISIGYIIPVGVSNCYNVLYFYVNVAASPLCVPFPIYFSYALFKVFLIEDLYHD